MIIPARFKDDKIIYLLPIAGGQEPPPPEQIVTRTYGSVYDGESDTYYDWLLSAYRPTAEAAAINLASAGAQQIVSVAGTDKLLIQSVSLTVDGETNITLYVSGTPISGPMDFGGDGEPRGIVIPFPFSPLDCGYGGSFSVGSSNAVQVSGIVSYIVV